MKVAHITSVHPHNDNRIFYKECISLHKAGYDVTLIAAGVEHQIIDGIKIVGSKKERGGRVTRMIKTSFVNMLQACKNVDADIYHFHDPELMFVGFYLKLLGKKVIYDIHENNPASILSKPYIKSQFVKKSLSILFDIFERSVSKVFDALVTARPDITERFHHGRVVTLRNFPMLPDFSTIKEVDIHKTKPSVIYVGGMAQIRGINELLDAFEKLDKYELWLLGPISEEALRNRITKGCKNVRYLGVVEPFEIFAYILKADIGIITFLPAPNHLNTLATKPFEYMACGKPIVMSNFEYWKETFQESALYVDPEDTYDIAQTITYLMKNRDLREKMGAFNQQLATTEYNWEKEGQKLIDLYKGLER